MAQLAMPLQIAGAVVSAGSSIMGGLAAGAAGKAQQKQYRAQANTTRALAQRRMIEEKRQGEHALSRALAVGAASGGGGLETEGFSNLAGGIVAESHMRAMMELWQGEDQARGQEYAGKIARWEGKQKKTAGFLNAATTLLQTGASIAGGMGGPPRPDSSPYVANLGVRANDSWYRSYNDGWRFQARNL